MSLDQLRKGMKTLSLLSEMEKHPSLFERVFNQGEKELTPDDLKDLLLFPQQKEPTQGMLVKFLDESPQNCTIFSSFVQDVKISYHCIIRRLRWSSMI